MSKWKSVLTLTVAAAMVATTAFAQSGAAAPGTTPPTSGTTTPDSTTDPAKSSDTMKSTDTMKSSDMRKSEKKSRMRSASADNRERVKAVQQALKDKGHDPGPVDGVMGPKTRAALKDFQKKEGVKDTGRLDQETLAKLGVEATTSGTSASPPTTSSPGPDSSSGSSSAPSSSPSSTPGAGSSPSDSTAPGKK